MLYSTFFCLHTTSSNSSSKMKTYTCQLLIMRFWQLQLTRGSFKSFLIPRQRDLYSRFEKEIVKWIVVKMSKMSGIWWCCYIGFEENNYFKLVETEQERSVFLLLFGHTFWTCQIRQSMTSFQLSTKTTHRKTSSGSNTKFRKQFSSLFSSQLRIRILWQTQW